MFIARCNVTKDDHVLEVGSGIGGPSRYHNQQPQAADAICTSVSQPVLALSMPGYNRYVAHRTGCKVTALELQEDLDQVAADLTKRCRLDGRVTCRAGDIVELDLKKVSEAW